MSNPRVRKTIKPKGVILFNNPYIGMKHGYDMVDVSKEDNPEQYMYTAEELQEKVGKPFIIQLTIFHELARQK